MDCDKREEKYFGSFVYRFVRRKEANAICNAMTAAFVFWMVSKEK
jgi:hypothetical protein